MTKTAQQNESLLRVEGLKKYFPIEKGFFRKHVGLVKAVDDVSFAVRRGESLGLVGESGCGKTTLGRCLLRVIEPTDGDIQFRFNDLSFDFRKLNPKELRSMRKYAQMIFQDPYSSLNPRMTVMDIIAEPLRVNNLASGSELQDRVRELVDTVGLDVKHMKRYPHAFSGGQRQRIGIARALACHPPFIVADEAVSALDVSVQAQILNLLKRLQRDFHITYLFITHDLGVIHHVSDRVMVMYLGKVVELAETRELFRKPLHPYTEMLLGAVPKIGSEGVSRYSSPGEPPNPAAPPPGCAFHPRCKYADALCRSEVPSLRDAGGGHMVSCHRACQAESTDAAATAE